MKSVRWTLNREEINKVAKNAVIFFAPVALIYLTFTLTAVEDGFSPSDLVPNNQAVTAISLWLLNTLIDVFRKFNQGV